MKIKLNKTLTLVIVFLMILPTFSALLPLAQAQESNFGKTDKGANRWYFFNSHAKVVCRFQAPEDGEITKITFYGQAMASDMQFRAVIYDDNAGAPGALRAYGRQVALSETQSWQSAAISLNATGGTYYWIGIQFFGIRCDFWYDPGALSQTAWNIDALDPDDPFGTPNYQNYELSIYATYTPPGPRTWTVDDDRVECPNANFTSIQEAINASRSRDTIYVYPGTYNENVSVAFLQNVTLQGEDRQTTMIDGSLWFEIAVDNFNVDNFTITGDLRIGGPFANVRNSVVSNCIVFEETIIGADTFDNTLVNNSLSSITLGARIGMNHPGAYHAIIENNTISEGISVEGTYHEIRNNNISGGVRIGFGSFGSNNHEIRNNRLIDNGIEEGPAPGPLQGFSGVNLISGNLFLNPSGNMTGLKIASYVLQNGSTRHPDTIVGNTFVNNSKAVVLIGQEGAHEHVGNIFHHNNFINNIVQVETSRLIVNNWTDGTEGNYWDDYMDDDFYSGPFQNETGPDGIGDTPYLIDANNTDYYPLIHPWGSISICGIVYYPTIQKALEAANAGDTIHVKAGVYNESLGIGFKNNIKLVGESRLNTIVNGSLRSEYCHNIAVMNFRFEGGLGFYPDALGAALGIVIHNNTIRSGIDLTACNSKVAMNIIEGGLAVHGIWPGSASDNIIENNTLIGSGIVIGPTSYDNTVTGNTIINASTGVWEQGGSVIPGPDSRRHSIIGNHIIECGVGVKISKAPMSEPMLYSCSNVSGNTLERNGYGILLEKATNVTIYHNNFVNNTVQAYTNQSYPNFWDYEYEGNYWSDYNGTDANHDLIGDTPYVIDGNNTDYYPMMYPTFFRLRPPTYSDMGTNTTVAGQPCLFYAKWSDDMEARTWNMDGLALSGFIFSTNNTGSWRNSTWTPLSGYVAWSNVTEVLNSTVGVTVSYRFYCRDTYNNWNRTPILSFNVTSPPTYNSSLNMQVFSSPALVGYEVNIVGSLVYQHNGSGIRNAPVQLYRSITGTGYFSIASTTTNPNGSFSVTWFSLASGDYIIRAFYAGDFPINGTEATVNLVIRDIEERVFSVSSNSTVSDLTFNSTAREITFTVSGPAGTMGYVNIFLSKDLVPDISNLKIYLDGVGKEYEAVSLDGVWFIHLSYHHSAHTIKIALPTALPTHTFQPLATQNVAILVTALVVAFTIALSFRKKKSSIPSQIYRKA